MLLFDGTGYLSLSDAKRVQFVWTARVNKDCVLWTNLVKARPRTSVPWRGVCRPAVRCVWSSEETIRSLGSESSTVRFGNKPKLKSDLRQDWDVSPQNSRSAITRYALSPRSPRPRLVRYLCSFHAYVSWEIPKFREASHDSFDDLLCDCSFTAQASFRKRLGKLGCTSGKQDRVAG